MRLTAELVARSPSFINTLKDRELDLRGQKIPLIENLGATNDQYDTIDLSDNEIKKLENFPLLPRLQTIFASNNRITRILPSITESLPNLDTLILTNNNVTRLEDVDALVGFKKLKTLSLLDNPVTKRPGYRNYVIHKIPSLKLLDFKKVKVKEREEAKRTYTKQDKSEKTSAAEPENEQQAEAVKMAVEQAIKNAKSFDDVTRIDNTLAAGKLPPEVLQHLKPQEVNNNQTKQ